MKHSNRLSARKYARFPLVLFLGAILVAAVRPVGPALTAGQSIPEIILQVNDTIVSPIDTVYYLAVYLSNPLQEVAGLEMRLQGSPTGLIKLPDSAKIETTQICLNPPTCDSFDTSVDTLSVSPVDTVGTAIGGWEFMQARAQTDYNFRIVAVADFLPGGNNPPPIPTGGPHLLFKMLLEREVPYEILDTLQDRTVNWIVQHNDTKFSNPSAELIGLQESTICLNPPTCDSLDTVTYFDTANVNIYVDGATTFGPNCLPGDANGDGVYSAADIVTLVNYVFKGGAEPPCDGAAGDADCSGGITSADIVVMVNYIFKAGSAPCIP